MYKEVVISIFVVVIIIIGNVITQNNTAKSVEEINNNLSMLHEEITKQEIDQEKSKQQMAKTEKDWEKRYETMAYYIEHNELEKVGTELSELKANIEMEEYSQGVEHLENCIFILEHIKDKSALKIVNIF